MLMEIDNLSVRYNTREGALHAAENVSLTIGQDEVLGIAGESGCGKTTLIKALIRLLPGSATVTADKLTHKGLNLLALSDAEFRKQIIWNEIALVPQSAQASLNPVYRVGDQVVEAIQAHADHSKAQARERVAEVFDLVGLQPDLMNAYPHEFSGGMRQRAMIAMALVLEPSLIVMDEPTTGLDVLVQERIIRNIKELRGRIGSSILLITHDIAVIAEMSDRIAIMYGGQIMEVAPAIELFENAAHPYTLGLKNAFPSIKQLGKELISIPGSPPVLMGGLGGCPFAARCPFVEARCRAERPDFTQIGPDHRAACHRIDDAEMMRNKSSEKATWLSSTSTA
ncbi:MAG: ABC transporter ATP-binding protein [Rhizobiales bacterium]|nr:ABC transporter ATP-binding protein [Hyphomicrobiales bacterium]